MSATAVARAFVDDLIARGVRHAVLAPGSRSGPVARALFTAYRDGPIQLHVRVDEREAGFLALGLAKGHPHRVPVPVVTTSGTAVANLHPAMLEALHAHVPVWAVTADRPARLRGTGANQTTDQRRIFPGVPYVERFEDLVDGPAHLNLELDEPLLAPGDWDLDWHGDTASGMPASPVEDVAGFAVDARALGIVVGGDDSGRGARRAASAAGWPLVAEPTSGSRNGPDALVAGRLLLDHAPLADRIGQVLSFGHATLSRPVTRLLSRHDVDIVHVGTQETFPVPAGRNVTFVPSVSLVGRADEAWLDSWRSADEAATAAIDALTPGTPYEVARAVNAAVPPHGLLFVGASSPIRDLDLVARPYPVGERRFVIANRGLAGIDGTLSSAIGAALARGPMAPAIAYVGDLTFLHGSNGLLIGPAEQRPDLTIVVVNDDGGSIFSTLEQGAPAYADSFERVFATPTGADIGALCAGYRVPHRLVSAAELPAALAEDVRGIRVLEVPVDRAGRRHLDARISAATKAVLTP